MNSRAMIRNLDSTWSVYVSAMLASILLSCWLCLYNNVINPDGICYLQSAADIGIAGVKAASQLCDQAKWPFYAILIHGLAQVLHGNEMASAYLLDGMFSIVSVTAFIYLVRLLGGTVLTLWLAAFVILFAHEFASIREYIVRDHGFWAFYLVSLIALLAYFRQPRFWLAGLWSMSMMIATLFRIEGAIFLSLVPFAAALDSRRSIAQRLREFFELQALTLTIAVGFLVVSLVGLNNSLHWGRLVELQTQFIYGWSTLVDHFHVAADGLAQHVLNPYAAQDASVILVLLLCVWYVYSLVTNISFVYAFLGLYAWSRRALRLDSSARLALISYIAINILITAVYLAENIFISKRYLIALSLVLMVWVPFALDKLWQARKERLLLCCAVTLLLLLNAASTLFHFGYSKDYIREAGHWLQLNVPSHATLFSNDELVMYYSHHFGDAIFQTARSNTDLAVITQGQWQHYDYLALRVNKPQTSTVAVLKELKGPPLRVFANRRGDKVVIYKIVH